MPTKWLQERTNGSKNKHGIPPPRGLRGRDRFQATRFKTDFTAWHCSFKKIEGGWRLTALRHAARAGSSSPMSHRGYTVTFPLLRRCVPAHPRSTRTTNVPCCQHNAKAKDQGQRQHRRSTTGTMEGWSGTWASVVTAGCACNSARDSASTGGAPRELWRGGWERGPAL